MNSKSQLISNFDHLPENPTVDQLNVHLLFVEKVQKGLTDSNQGNVFTKEQAKEKLSKWLK